jgi:dihydropyrimidinase
MTAANSTPSRPSCRARGRHRAISLAELSTCRAAGPRLNQGSHARDPARPGARARVYGETCPQYLFLSEEDFEKPGEGAPKNASRAAARVDNQAIWTGLAARTWVLSSDHAAFKYDDVRGKKLPGAAQSFRKIPNGVPGVETRLPLLFSEGVNKGRITLQQFVALSSTNAARLYGLHPRKGTIAVGADADIVCGSQAARQPPQSILHHNCDPAYEGRELTGIR